MMKIDRKKIYTLIAIAKQQLGYNDEAHQYVLMSFGAVEKNGRISATTLSDAKLNDVYQLYKAKGFKPKRKTQYQGLGSRKGTKNKKIGYIQYLLVRLQQNWQYADSLAKKMFNVDRVHWLTDYQANSIIKALRLHCERQGIEL